MSMPKPISNLGLAFKAKKVIWGEKAVLQSMNVIKLVILAHDAGPNIHAKIQKKAEFYQCPIVTSYSHRAITQATGKKTMCVGITDDGFKELLM